MGVGKNILDQAGASIARVAREYAMYGGLILWRMTSMWPSYAKACKNGTNGAEHILKSNRI
jgi:hypothetical protein